MRNKNLNVKMWQVALATATLSGIISCNNSQKDNTTTGSDTLNMTNTVSTTSTVTTANKTDTSADNQFLRKAALINLEEIRVGRLAEKKGVALDIREMGKMLENDHQKSLTELTALATKKSVALPQELDSGGQSDYRDLDSKNGKEFDKKFCDMMVSGHKDAISLFEKESSQTTDNDIRNWATETLPVLHKHLDEATKCQDMMAAK